jgi:catechol 2,3-dioxygenase-like lactoylglutathione lyase family enzyme
MTRSLPPTENIVKTTIHRVVIAVRDLDEAVARYESLFGARFVRTGAAVAEVTGVAVAADSDAGLELACPLPGARTPIAADIAGWLEERGEGIYGLGVNAGDTFDEAIQTARESDLTFAIEPFSFTQDQIDEEFGGRYSRYEEAIVDRKHLGFALAYNSIVKKH